MTKELVPLDFVETINYIPPDAFDLVMSSCANNLKYIENVFDGEKWVPKES